MLKFGPQMLELRMWNLAAQLDSQPSPALATHLYIKQACSRGASGKSSNLSHSKAWLSTIDSFQDRIVEIHLPFQISTDRFESNFLANLIATLCLFSSGLRNVRFFSASRSTRIDGLYRDHDQHDKSLSGRCDIIWVLCLNNMRCDA